MKERPILFSGAMVRAILEGRKTVTRREVVSHSRKRPYMVMMNDHPDFPGCQQPFQADEHGSISFEEKGQCEFPIACPYGRVGDRLWVRESWSDVNLFGAPGIAYRADGDIRDLMEDESFHEDGRFFNYEDPRVKPFAFACWADDLISGVEGKWRPSIHMPRWASRLLLEITDVRIERLHEISVQQVRREGCEVREFWLFGADAEQSQKIAARVFGNLWEDINGRESWDANPWVWVVEFRRVQP